MPEVTDANHLLVRSGVYPRRNCCRASAAPQGLTGDDGQIPLGRTNLPAGQSTSRGAPATEAYQASLHGHWGTIPGLNFVYIHMNRIINKYDLNAIYIAGPGLGRLGMVANAYQEGTYSEFYPIISKDTEELDRRRQEALDRYAPHPTLSIPEGLSP